MKWTRLIKLFAGLVAALMGSTAEAAPPLTQIYDTLYKADGTLFSGSATISWRSFSAADSSNIPTNAVAVQVVGGLLRVKLVPTTNAAGNAYYTVRFSAEGKTQFTELWAVPPSALALAVKDIRIPSPPGSKVTMETSLVQMVDVAGLTEALADRPTKSIGYAPNRAAFIDETGEIAAVSGSPGDCVKVDGTSGPCGSGAALGFVDQETPVGAVNGSNATFVLSQAPYPAGSLHLFRNGILQRVVVDYTLSGNAVTFLSVSTPQAGDQLLASYRAAP